VERVEENQKLTIGTVLAGKYEVEQELGSGGFATVYRARHTSIPTLFFAIKVLHAEHAYNPAIRKKFKREAETVAALRSRHVVKVTDVGELDNQVPFIVMEFIEGVPLDELLKQCGRLLPRDVSRIAEGVLRALEEAHQLGIVHRDLKPANVFMVEESGDPPYARVLDFGIAKVLAGSESGVTGGTQTVAGQVSCTPAYAAPELLGGETTPQVDLYALGHMMAELLDGRAPYDIHDNALMVAAEHLRPGEVPLGGNAEESGLQEVIRRACEKDPADRYTSATEMLTDLQNARVALNAKPAQHTLHLASPYKLDTLVDSSPRQTQAMRPRSTNPPTTAVLAQDALQRRKKVMIGAIVGVTVVLMLAFVGLLSLLGVFSGGGESTAESLGAAAAVDTPERPQEPGAGAEATDPTTTETPGQGDSPAHVEQDSAFVAVDDPAEADPETDSAQRIGSEDAVALTAQPDENNAATEGEEVEAVDPEPEVVAATPPTRERDRDRERTPREATPTREREVREEEASSQRVPPEEVASEPRVTEPAEPVREPEVIPQNPFGRTEIRER